MGERRAAGGGGGGRGAGCALAAGPSVQPIDSSILHLQFAPVRFSWEKEKEEEEEEDKLPPPRRPAPVQRERQEVRFGAHGQEEEEDGFSRSIREASERRVLQKTPLRPGPRSIRPCPSDASPWCLGWRPAHVALLLASGLAGGRSRPNRPGGAQGSRLGSRLDP